MISGKQMFHVVLVLLMGGGITGLFLGTMLVLRPAWLSQANKYANNWIATRQISSLLERVIKLDRWLYRHHQAAGAFLLAGAVFLTYFFTARFDKFRVLAGLTNAYAIPPLFADILLDSTVLSILLGASFVLIVSLFLLIRPSMLRGFEQGANQWISLRRALKPFEISRLGLDEFVSQNIQMAGVLLLLGSLYTVVLLTAWL